MCMLSARPERLRSTRWGAQATLGTCVANDVAMPQIGERPHSFRAFADDEKTNTQLVWRRLGQRTQQFSGNRGNCCVANRVTIGTDLVPFQPPVR